MLDFNSAVSNGYKRTRYLVWEKRSWARWWRYSLLSTMTGSGGGGGGGGFNVPTASPHDAKRKTAMLGVILATGALGQVDMASMALVLGVVLAGMMMLLFFVWLSNCAQFVFIENLVYDRHMLLEPLGRLKGQGTSLFLFSLSILFGLLVPFAVVVAVGAGLMVWMRESIPLLVVGGLLMLGALLTVICLLVAILSTTTQLVVPVSYRQRTNVSDGWSLLWPTLKSHKLDWFLFLLCQIGLTMAGGLVTIFALLAVALVAGLVFGLILGLPAFLCYTSGAHIPAMVLGFGFLLLFLLTLMLSGFLMQMPIGVFVRCFSIYIMQQLTPEFGLLPLGGRPLEAPPEEEEIDSPAPLGSVSLREGDGEWQRPEF